MKRKTRNLVVGAALVVVVGGGIGTALASGPPQRGGGAHGAADTPGDFGRPVHHVKLFVRGTDGAELSVNTRDATNPDHANKVQGPPGSVLTLDVPDGATGVRVAVVTLGGQGATLLTDRIGVVHEDHCYRTTSTGSHASAGRTTC